MLIGGCLSIQQLIQLPKLIFILSIPVNGLNPGQWHPSGHPHDERFKGLTNRLNIARTFLVILICVIGRDLEHLISVLTLDRGECHTNEERVEEVKEQVVDQGEEEG